MFMLVGHVILNSYDYVTLIKLNDGPFFAWFGGEKELVRVMSYWPSTPYFLIGNNQIL